MKLFSLYLALAAMEYQGVWKIESAKTAPWWNGPSLPASSLIGKRITFGTKSIAGPHPLGCPAARYAFVDSPAEGLFQGAFDEMKRRNPKGPTPAELAATAGLRGTSAKWRTLQTGCDIDFHFISERTAAFALDNYIYVIRKHQ